MVNKLLLVFICSYSALSFSIDRQTSVLVSRGGFNGLASLEYSESNGGLKSSLTLKNFDLEKLGCSSPKSESPSPVKFVVSSVKDIEVQDEKSKPLLDIFSSLKISDLKKSGECGQGCVKYSNDRLTVHYRNKKVLRVEVRGATSKVSQSEGDLVCPLFGAQSKQIQIQTNKQRYGNWCGLGNPTDKAPIDAIDSACQEHDFCYDRVHSHDCGCDKRFLNKLGSVRAPETPGSEEYRLAAMALFRGKSCLCRVSTRRFECGTGGCRWITNYNWLPVGRHAHCPGA